MFHLQHELMTTEFVIDEVAKSLDLNPNRFSLVAALLGSYILPTSELSDFHLRLVPELKMAQEGKYKVGFERVIRAVVNYVRALPSVEDYETISKDIFDSDKDARLKKLKEAVTYFYKGTKEGYSKQKPVTAKKNQKQPKDSIKLASEQQSDQNDK
jgi:hypothetical protein